MSTQFFVSNCIPYEQMEPHMEERRSRQRYFVRWPVLIETLDAAGTASRASGTLRDISSRGAFVRLTGHTVLGRRLKVSIKLPLQEDVWMSYTAQVLRLERVGLDLGIALQFYDKKPSFRTIEQRAS
jgi:hypothetical protein